MGRDDSYAMKLASLEIKGDIRNYGRIRFKRLMDKFDINIININGGVIEFSIQDKVFFYGGTKQIIRKKGCQDWTGKIITFLKEEFNGVIPMRINEPGVFTFGKYTGRNIEEILIIDPNYVYWCQENIEDFLLKIGLK